MTPFRWRTTTRFPLCCNFLNAGVIPLTRTVRKANSPRSRPLKAFPHVVQKMPRSGRNVARTWFHRTVILATTFSLLVYLAVDLLYFLVDPRLEY